MRGKLLAALGGTFALTAVVLGFIFFSGPKSAPALDTGASFDIKAETETSAGVDPDSDFIITSDSNLSANDLKSLMTLSPELEYDLRVADGGYRIHPEGLLEPNTLYNVSIKQGNGLPDLSWAFQTQNQFLVTSSFPGSQSTDVPVNSGIEITFSQEVGDISQHFVIEPAVKGSFETHGKTVAFVPSEALADDTVYTVALKAGLTSKAGMALAESHIFSFRTSAVWEESEKYGYSSNQFWVMDFTESYLPQDPVVISVYADNRFDNDKFTLDLYRLKDAKDYMAKAMEQREHVDQVIGRNDDYMLDVSGLEKVQNFTDQYHRQYDNNWYPGYFMLPENPGTGWYLLDIKGVDNKLHGQKLIQISDGAVYAQSLNGQLLVWVNDAASGKSVAGAKLTVATGEQQAQATTDQQGLAKLEVTTDATWAKLEVTFDGKTFADLLWLVPPEEESLATSYYTYIYSDREAYLPTDTVKLWGFVLPRKSGVALPSTLTLNYEGLNSGGIEIKVNKDGSFSTEVSFEHRVSGYWSFRFSIGEKDLASKNVLIMEYKKPVYTFTLTNRKDYYRYGENIDLDIAATFFDGTPAGSVDLQVYPEGNVVTDQYGKAKASFPVTRYGDSWQPTYQYYSVTTTGTEDDSTYVNGQAIYFPSDYMLEAVKQEAADGKFQLQLQANKIDFTKLNPEQNLYEQTDGLKGAAAQLSGEITIKKTTYVKKEVGEYYDFINKITVKRYEYDPVTMVDRTLPFTTDSNGKFTTDALAYPQEENSYYEAVITFTSPQQGNPKISQSLYIGDRYYPDDQQDDSYTLAPEDYADTTMQENDTVKLYLNNGSKKVANQGQVLYVTSQDKILDQALTGEDAVDFTYLAAYIPNCFVSGAYFDGKHIYTMGTLYLNFDPAERMLNVELHTDKEAYGPGDTVTVTAKVTGPDGKPVPGGLLLSVADEAAFAVQEQQLNVLSDLYRSVYWSYSRTYGSYKQHTMESVNDAAGAAEGGGDGGSDSLRREFLDTAAFLPTETDRNGNATVTFTLPDNLTSWRVSAIAYTKDAYAGSGLSNVRSTLEFFLNPVVGTEYLTADDISLSLRAAGTAIQDSTEVAYQLTVSGNGQNITKSYNGKAGTFTFCNLGKLPAGEYTLTMRGTAGAHQDAIEQTFQVVDSMKELPISKLITAEEISAIQALRYPVRLLLFDQDNAMYFRTLGNLISQNGNRADQRLARAIAETRLREYYQEETAKPQEDLLSDLQSWDGGIRLLPYADSDPELTAWVCAIGSDYIDKSKAQKYLYELLQDPDATQSNVAFAYMGLAALKEPVLFDLRQLLAESNDWGYSDRMTLALALSLAGDQTGARDWYRQQVAPKVTSNEQWKFIDGNDGAALTAQAAALALHSQDADGLGLLTYLLEQPSADVLTVREQLLYVSTYQPAQNSDTTYQYVLNGQQQEGDFGETGCQLLSLNAQELKDLQLKSLSGKLGILACYTGDVTEIAESNDLITVEKSYQNTLSLGGNATKVTLKVKFADDAPLGWYNLTDVVPAGARFTRANSSEDTANRNWYFYGQEMQRLSFELIRSENPDGSKTKEITLAYYIRGILPGSYQVEGAVVQHENAPVASYSKEGTITIGD